MKTIIVCVTSDLATDNRVLRHCDLMHQMGFKVLLVGRKLPWSPAIPDLPYATHRVKLPFHQGPLFYFSYNLWLFFFIIFHKTTVVWANDLDTVLPCFIISKIRGQALVMDSHELFTEVPELRDSPFKRSIWKFIEKYVSVKATIFITVNQSIAKIFQEKYRIVPKIVRNIPKRVALAPAHEKHLIGIPEDHLVVIIQGSGINKGRGLDETLDAINTLNGVSLLIIGGGNAINEAKQKTNSLGLQTKVHFIPRVPYQEMMQYTQMAAIGLAYDADPCLNFHYALPNKIFDYFHAGVAVISGPQPEISNLVSTYECGYLMKSISPESIRWAISFYQKHPELLSLHQRNSKKAAEIEHWDNEKKHLENILYTLM